jgi:hypothetical protein
VCFPARRAFYTGSDASSDQFFNSSSAKQAYKNHLKTVVNRRNTINGKVRALFCARPAQLWF